MTEADYRQIEADCRQLRGALAKFEAIEAIVPGLSTALETLLATDAAQAEQFANLRREVHRLSTAVDGPPHIDALRTAVSHLDRAAATPPLAHRGAIERVLGGFVSLFKAGDSARRPWLLITLLGITFVAFLVWLGSAEWSDPAGRAERDRRARESFVLDSLKLQKELDALRTQVRRNTVTNDVQDEEIDTLAADLDSLTSDTP